MKNLADTPLSVLDLAPVAEGKTIAESLHNTLDLARHVEALGYHRYWLAEHHNLEGIASAATSAIDLVTLLAALKKFEWVREESCFRTMHL